MLAQWPHLLAPPTLLPAGLRPVLGMIDGGALFRASLLTHTYSMHADPIVSSFVVAFAFGMAITAMVYMTAHTSGGQLNPAITAGCMVAGVTTPAQAVANIIAQCVGSMLSAFFLILLVPSEVRNAANMAANTVPEGSNVHRALLGTLLFAFRSDFVCAAVCISSPPMPPLLNASTLCSRRGLLSCLQ